MAQNSHMNIIIMGINVVTERWKINTLIQKLPQGPAPPVAPPLPEHPGESLNSVQALQRDERRKDEEY